MKIGKITGNNRIPMKNVFNRTSIFTAVQKRYYDQTIDKSSPVLFENRQYKLKMTGCRLNHTYDYPLLALIIKFWKNSVLSGASVDAEVVIPISEIDTLFNLQFKQKKRRNYDPIENSLQRLDSSKLCLDIKNKKVVRRSSIIEKPEIDYDEKCIKVQIGNLVKKLYQDDSDYTFVDIEYIISAPSESSKALMKCFATQSNQYIDFKFDYLCNLLGYKNRQPAVSSSKAREYIIKALNELVDIKFLTIYKTNVKAGWDSIRIIRSSVCSDVAEAEKLLVNSVSNFKTIKANRRKASSSSESDTSLNNLPF